MTSLGAASIELSLDRSRFDRDLAQLANENAPSLTPRLKLDVKDFNNQIAGLQGFIPTLSVPVSLDTSSIRVADVRRKFSDIGRNAALGFADGFAGADKGIESTIDSLVKNAKSQLEIQSPSRVFRQIGKYAADGLRNKRGE